MSPLTALRRRVARRPARVARARRGFSLVELIVAIMVLSIGVLGLAATAAIVTRQMGGGAQQTIAASLAYSRFERLSGRPCAAMTSGLETTRGIRERWIVSGTNRAMRMVSDTISFNSGGRTRRITYTSSVLCR